MAKLQLTISDDERGYSSLTVDIDPYNIDEFVEQFEDYFCGMSLSNAHPNLIPNYAEID